MNSIHLLLVMLAAMLVVAGVEAVNVSFDNATCGIHVVKDIPTNVNGYIAVYPSELESASVTSSCNAPIIYVSTNEYVKTPNYYNPSEPIYPQEYYTYETWAQSMLSAINPDPSNKYSGIEITSGRSGAMIYYELRRQTILMEKENEMLQEQVNLMRSCGKV
jgi:hypothetical protein